MILLLPLFLIATAQVGQATEVSFDYKDFSSISGLTLNGAAAQSGHRLRLVPASRDLAGTAYRTTSVPWDSLTGFSASFAFSVRTAAGSSLGATDGFAFLLQSSDNGAFALGGSGQGLGYVGLSPSLAVVFRGRAPSFIGAIPGGVDPSYLPNPFEPPGSTAFAEGFFYERSHFAWIDYSPADMLLAVFLAPDASKPSNPVMTTTIDIFGTLGPQPYVGFSAGNGGAFATQDILSWSFTSTQIPEPGTGLLIITLAALHRMRRR